MKATLTIRFASALVTAILGSCGSGATAAGGGSAAGFRSSELLGRPTAGSVTVSAVFHGHDHVFVKQELDGIVYQEVPQPGATNSRNGPELAASYHYKSGVIDSSAGHLRVTVGPGKAQVDYVRSYLPKDEGQGRINGAVAQSYLIP